MMPRLITRVTMQITGSGSPGITVPEQRSSYSFNWAMVTVPAQLTWLISLGLC